MPAMSRMAEVARLKELEAKAEPEWRRGESGNIYCKKSDRYPLLMPYGINSNSAEVQLAADLRNAAPWLLNREKWLLEDNEKRAIEQNVQAKRIADLEQKLLTSECREREAGERIAELDADAQRLHDRKEEFATELVKANQRATKLYDQFKEDQYTIAKQRAALKNLGKKYHEQREGRRSDARIFAASQTAMASQIASLMEIAIAERAKIIFHDQMMPTMSINNWDTIPDDDFEIKVGNCMLPVKGKKYWMSEARQQLEAEYEAMRK